VGQELWWLDVERAQCNRQTVGVGKAKCVVYPIGSVILISHLPFAVPLTKVKCFQSDL
jgi:hypothetical protein